MGTSRLSEVHEGLKVGCAGARGELSPDRPQQLLDRTLRPQPGPCSWASASLGLEGGDGLGRWVLLTLWHLPQPALVKPLVLHVALGRAGGSAGDVITRQTLPEEVRLAQQML